MHHLPGRRFAVARRADYVRAAFGASILLGAAATVMRMWPGPRLERLWGRWTVRLLDIDVAISGAGHVDPEERYVVAPLHEGFADVAALLQLPLSMKFVAREELAHWRALGPHLRRAGHVIVDPERPLSAYRNLIESAARVFDSGQSLVIFPQGTILGIESRFTRGAFHVADRFSRPLLPVVLSGSHRVWEHPFSPLVRFGCRIDMEVLQPLEPGTALEAMEILERDMKRRAMRAPAAPRHFVPERDGWWDAYHYEIDPAFPELAQRVARHRAGPDAWRAEEDPDDRRQNRRGSRILDPGPRTSDFGLRTED